MLGLAKLELTLKRAPLLATINREWGQKIRLFLPHIFVIFFFRSKIEFSWRVDFRRREFGDAIWPLEIVKQELRLTCCKFQHTRSADAK